MLLKLGVDPLLRKMESHCDEQGRLFISLGAKREGAFIGTFATR